MDRLQIIKNFLIINVTLSGEGCCEGQARAVKLGEGFRGFCIYMSTFDDREKGFEAKFVHDQDFEFKAANRRNRLVGLWAGEKMGLTGASLEDYAKAVVRADFEQPGEEDVIRKVLGDLKASKLNISESEVRTKLAELHAQAREQLKSQG